MRVCQRGWAGRPWARNPKTPHFYWLGLGRPGPPQSLTFIDGPGPARPPKALTFIDGPWARPAHPNPSLLSTGPGRPKPLTSIGQTPHFYQPGQAALPRRYPSQRYPGTPPERPPPICPGLGPSLFGKPSCNQGQCALRSIASRSVRDSQTAAKTSPLPG